jgi:DNA gyrase inhibitor GyrI
MTTPVLEQPTQRVIIVTRTGQGITAFGRTMSLRAWAQEMGLSPAAIHYRLKQGFPPEVALTAQLRGGRNR